MLIIFSCQKINQTPGLSQQVRSELRGRMSPSSWERLCFDSSSYDGDGDHLFFRVGFNGEPFSQHFMLLDISRGGVILSGREITLRLSYTDGHANGSITLTGLDREVLLQNAAIHDGYIQKKAEGFTLRDMIVPGDIGSVLPEVVLVTSYNSTVNTLTAYYSLAGLSGYNITSNTYASSKPATTGNPDKPDHVTGAAGTGSTIKVDYETAVSKSAIDLAAYLKCFTSVPDGGAQCSIELFTDIPVDGHPEDFFNWDNGSPGHTFLRLQKTNGTNSIFQVIGFYPQQGWKTIATPAPVPGKFVDNSSHEFNASIKMNLNSTQFQSLLTEISRHKNDKYDIDEYNCTDFALEIFNYQRTNKLTIAKYFLPGGQTPYGTSTPQAVYLELQSIKAIGGNDAVNVNLPGYKGYVANGKGPC